MNFRQIVVTLVAVGLAYMPSPAGAEGSGITTNQFPILASGCNGCHSGGAIPTVTLTGPTTVDTNRTNEYTVIISSVGSQIYGGLTAFSPSGQLTVGGADSDKTKLKPGTDNRGEITHSSKKAEVAGEIRFSFRWKAPNVPGPAMIDVWGNAVDGSGSSGDRAAFSSLAITVNQGPPIPVPASSPAAALAFALLLLAAATWHLRRHANAGQ